MDKLTIKITLTVEVDPKEWAAAYGTKLDKKEIVAEVKNYIANSDIGAGDAPIKVLNWK